MPQEGRHTALSINVIQTHNNKMFSPCGTFNWLGHGSLKWSKIHGSVRLDPN